MVEPQSDVRWPDEVGERVKELFERFQNVEFDGRYEAFVQLISIGAVVLVGEYPDLSGATPVKVQLSAQAIEYAKIVEFSKPEHWGTHSFSVDDHIPGILRKLKPKDFTLSDLVLVLTGIDDLHFNGRNSVAEALANKLVRHGHTRITSPPMGPRVYAVTNEAIEEYHL